MPPSFCPRFAQLDRPPRKFFPKFSASHAPALGVPKFPINPRPPVASWHQSGTPFLHFTTTPRLAFAYTVLPDRPVYMEGADFPLVAFRCAPAVDRHNGRSWLSRGPGRPPQSEPTPPTTTTPRLATADPHRYQARPVEVDAPWWFSAPYQPTPTYPNQCHTSRH